MARAIASRLCRHVLSSVVLAAVFAGASAFAEPPAPPSGVEILQDLKSFSQMATVLHIAAHPDDENTNLITYLARGRGYRTAYLSINRGDGGQNLIGAEFGAELGYIRTNELLAARRLDKGMQFFTRAIDFGYSKSPDETLRIWDHQKVLEDVVRVIRTFRPDVIVTRFSAAAQQGQHGHHTASAMLGIEAFKVAGDPKVLPDVPVWQPKRLLQNGAGGGGRGGAGGGVSMASGGTDPVLNLTYGAIAGQSRAMHKSQGFGAAGGGGGGRGGGGNPQESFSLLAGDPATMDIMDGIDTTWGRVGAGGAEIAKLTADAITKFDANNPSASVPALLAIKKLAAAVPEDPVVLERRALLDRIIAACAGISVETTIDNSDVIPGQELKLRQTVVVRSNVPVKWVTRLTPAGVQDISANQPATRDLSATLPANTPVSQPYWMREDPAAGIYTVRDAIMIGRPENPPVMPLVQEFDVSGERIRLADEPVQLIAKATPAQERRRLEVIAPVSLAFASEVRIFAPGTAKSVEVEVTARRANSAGSVKLNVPAGWTITPASQNFSLAAVGERRTFSFTVTPPSAAAEATFSAAATIGGQSYNTSWKEISYDHIPRLLMQWPATIKAVAADVKTKGKSIAYLPGAGDSVAECIRQMGYTVKEIDTADLTAEKLKQYDTLVIGVRAFAARDDLRANSPTLKAIFDYAEAGGTVVAQYNRNEQGTNVTLPPFPITIANQRVTDETAKITFLVPESPVLNVPNKITDADFANWVQERSIYLPNVPAGSPFEQILGASDPGETQPNTSLLVAKHGKGHFVYTSLAFFRQLPAGNPGAYRLFANLVSLGKQ